MKKLTIIILFLLSITAGYAQNRFSFGVRAGYGYSSLTSYAGASYKPTVQIGILGELKLLKPFFVQAEVLYSNPGYKENDIFGNQININYNSIQIPIQAKIKFGKIVKPYYMLGLAPAVNFSGNGNNATTTANLVNTLGFEIGLPKIAPFIDFRYTQGLTTFVPPSPYYNNSNYLNIQFVLSAGIKF